jgi:hypothetical protein
MSICHTPWPYALHCGKPATVRLDHLDLCVDCWATYRPVILPAPGTRLRRMRLGPRERGWHRRTVVVVHLHADGSPALVEYRNAAGRLWRVPWGRGSDEGHRSVWMDWALGAEVEP